MSVGDLDVFKFILNLDFEAFLKVRNFNGLLNFEGIIKSVFVVVFGLDIAVLEFVDEFFVVLCQCALGPFVVLDYFL